MEIKNIEAHQQINGAKNKQAKQAEGSVSFSEYMQRRLQSDDGRPVEEGNPSALELYQLSEVGAVGARARIQHNASGGDVSDFLELIKKQPYLLDGVNLEGLNGEASGDQALSADDLRLLREKYDVDNLPMQKQYALFKDLTDLNALTKDDVQKTQLTVSPDEEELMGYLTKEPEFHDVRSVSEANPKGRLEVMIQNERFASQHVQKRYGKRCVSVNALADSHQRVLDALEQI